MKKVFLYLLLIVLLGCRNEDFLLESVDYQEDISRKFSVFTAQSPNDTIDYAKGFEILAKRYDSLYQENFTGYKDIENWDSKSTIPDHIDFTRKSQVFTNEEGDKWVIFPKIKKGIVSDLVVAYLVEDETVAGFYVEDRNSDFYRQNISLFQKEEVFFNKALTTNSICGSLGNPCHIGEVIIIAPRPITYPPSFPRFGGGGGSGGKWETPIGGCSMYELCHPDEGGGGGGGYSPPKKDDSNNYLCAQSNHSKNTANNIFQNNEVKQKMDNVLRNKIGAENEWAVAIGRNPNGSYSLSSPLEGSNSSGYIPDVPSGQYIADGHTHRNTGVPSGGDFYGMLQIITENPHYTTRFVYGEHFDKKEVYALVVVDRDLAKRFLEQYPRDRNYDEDNHTFNTNTNLGRDYHRMEKIGRDGYYNYNEVSKNNYSSRAIAMAYILEKYNTGLALLKADKKGNFQAFRVSDADHNSFGGSKKAGAKVSNCP